LRAKDKKEWLERNAYVLLSLCYQIGVFISRSSLSIITIRKVWYLTYAQVINFIFFFTVAYYKWLPTSLQLPVMIWVGLMGGASYVNCYYLLLENDSLPKRLKELATNTASFFVDTGILAASLFGLIISNFVIVSQSK
jgi:battenin